MLAEKDKVGEPFGVMDAGKVMEEVKHDQHAPKTREKIDEKEATGNALIPKWYNGLMRPSCDGMIWTLTLLAVTWLSA